MNKITVIGSSNVDMIIKSSRLPKPGETVGDGIFAKVNGGKGANQAVAAARAGGNVAFISCLGGYDFASSMLNNFKNDLIDTQFVFTEQKVATGAIELAHKHKKKVLLNSGVVAIFVTGCYLENSLCQKFLN